MDTKSILADLRAERSRLDRAIAAIEQITNSRDARGGSNAGLAPAPKRKRRMSAATRKRLSEMAKARWAERKRKMKKTS